ncbi:kelch-like protein 40 [Biomphalaria glabrata]|nr:kelch-like protein 40 [Biomphalaria glabrata]
MKETESKCVTGEDISSETFELILETLYTGHGVLTNDNVIDIWRAAHQLQIPFLITECEEFAKTSLSLNNYIEYYKLAKLFDSKEVTEVIWSFILKNADSFFQTDFFFEMQISDVMKLIKSRDLEIISEDLVVIALFKWVEFKPHVQVEMSEDSDNLLNKESGQKRIRTGSNSFETPGIQQPNKDVTNNALDDNRKQHFFTLLSNTRTCLLSPSYLEWLIHCPLVRENKEATDLIIEAIFYQFQVSKRNGAWPPGAIFRKDGCYNNTAVAISKYQENELKIKAFSFSSKQWLRLPDLFCESRVTFAAFDKTLYALGESISATPILRSNSAKKHILKLINGNWIEVNIKFTFPPEHSVVVADAFLYILSPPSQEVWQVDLTTGISFQKADLPDTVPITHVTNYKYLIFAFYILESEGEKTAVDCFNTLQNTWISLDVLDGPATGMISFKHKLSTYLLQTNGNLWMVESNSENVEFKYLAKLWSCDWPLHGAVTFRDELYIYGVKSEALNQDFQKQLSLNDIFSQIVYMESEDTKSSTLIPLTLGRNCIRQSEV